MPILSLTPTSYIEHLHRPIWTEQKHHPSSLPLMATPSDPRHQRTPLALQTLLFLLLAAVAVIGLCATATVRKKRGRADHRRDRAEGAMGTVKAEECGDKQSGEMILCGWQAFKKAIAMSLHGGEGNKLAELANTAEGGTPRLPLWQRRILMGERCELPQFSGLILYDERGHPVCSSSNHDTLLKVKPTPAVTTLKDLL